MKEQKDWKKELEEKKNKILGTQDSFEGEESSLENKVNKVDKNIQSEELKAKEALASKTNNLDDINDIKKTLDRFADLRIEMREYVEKLAEDTSYKGRKKLRQENADLIEDYTKTKQDLDKRGQLAKNPIPFETLENSGVKKIAEEKLHTLTENLINSSEGYGKIDKEGNEVFPEFPNNYFDGLTINEVNDVLDRSIKRGDQKMIDLSREAFKRIQKKELADKKIAQDSVDNLTGKNKKKVVFDGNYPGGIAPNPETGYSAKLIKNNNPLSKIDKESTDKTTDLNNPETIKRGGTGESKYFYKDGKKISKEKFDKDLVDFNEKKKIENTTQGIPDNISEPIELSVEPSKKNKEQESDKLDLSEDQVSSILKKINGKNEVDREKVPSENNKPTQDEVFNIFNNLNNKSDKKQHEIKDYKLMTILNKRLKNHRLKVRELESEKNLTKEQKNQLILSKERVEIVERRIAKQSDIIFKHENKNSGRLEKMGNRFKHSWGKFKTWYAKPENKKELHKRILFTGAMTAGLALTGFGGLGMVAASTARFAGAYAGGEGARFLYNKNKKDYRQKMADFREKNKGVAKMTAGEDKVFENPEFSKYKKERESMNVSSAEYITTKNKWRKHWDRIGRMLGGFSIKGSEMLYDSINIIPETIPEIAPDVLPVTPSPDDVPSIIPVTPEVVEEFKIPDNAFTQKGDGITQILKRQFEANPNLAKQFDMENASASDYAKLAERFGYMDDNYEVRLELQEDMAYVPMVNEDGDLVIKEFKNGEMFERHCDFSDFEGKDIDPNEYLEKRGFDSRASINNNDNIVINETGEFSKEDIVAIHTGDLDEKINIIESGELNENLINKTNVLNRGVVNDVDLGVNSDAENYTQQTEVNNETRFQNNHTRELAPKVRRGSGFGRFIRNIFGGFMNHQRYSYPINGWGYQGPGVPIGDAQEYYRNLPRRGGGIINHTKSN